MDIKNMGVTKFILINKIKTLILKYLKTYLKIKNRDKSSLKE